jgi:hypothetical protein
MTMMKTPEQEACAMAEREENRLAALARRPLPYPNPWDAFDPTKVAADATDDEVQASYVAFRELCRPVPRKRVEWES